MSRDDKINKVESYMEVLLVYLIKQAAEKERSAHGPPSSEIPLKPSIERISAGRPADFI